MILYKNANVYSPSKMGYKDILVSNEKIIHIDDKIDSNKLIHEEIDLEGKILTPGFIDQHIHLIGAGGKNGFHSMTPELQLSQLISTGTTTAVGLLGTDGNIRSIKSLYGKVKSLELEGMSAYMYTGYYGLDPVYITNSIQDDMVFISNVLGCKIAISDIRSSYPTTHELLRLLKDIRVSGMMAGKKGILHIHLGNLDTKMDILFEIINKYNFPIKHISPTHVGRTEELFNQSIEFAKIGGVIDITTGASKFTEPHLAVIKALDNGVSINNICFSTDGNAGLEKRDEENNLVGFKAADITMNLKEVKFLIKSGLDIEDAVKLVTINPARNLGLSHKGRIEVGADADLCTFDKDFNLTDVISKGKLLYKSKKIIKKGSFE